MHYGTLDSASLRVMPIAAFGQLQLIAKTAVGTRDQMREMAHIQRPLSS